MKNKIIVITIILVVIILIVSVIYLCRSIFVKKECIPAITGGSFSIIFNTNGGESISPMHVGIAVSPDSYQDLPIPSRDGYTFDGWYYDKELTQKIDFTNSIEFRPIPDYVDGCQSGFKDIEIYAKWI